MTPSWIDDAEQLALAATPGPRTVDADDAMNVRAAHGGILCQIHWLRGKFGVDGRVMPSEGRANAELIAALSPERMLALLAAVQTLAKPAECRTGFDTLDAQSDAIDELPPGWFDKAAEYRRRTAEIWPVAHAALAALAKQQ